MAESGDCSRSSFEKRAFFESVLDAVGARWLSKYGLVASIGTARRVVVLYDVHANRLNPSTSRQQFPQSFVCSFTSKLLA